MMRSIWGEQILFAKKVLSIKRTFHIGKGYFPYRVKICKFQLSRKFRIESKVNTSCQLIRFVSSKSSSATTFTRPDRTRSSAMGRCLDKRNTCAGIARLGSASSSVYTASGGYRRSGSDRCPSCPYTSTARTCSAATAAPEFESTRSPGSWSRSRRPCSSADRQ